MRRAASISSQRSSAAVPTTLESDGRRIASRSSSPADLPSSCWAGPPPLRGPCGSWHGPALGCRPGARYLAVPGRARTGSAWAQAAGQGALAPGPRVRRHQPGAVSGGRVLAPRGGHTLWGQRAARRSSHGSDSPLFQPWGGLGVGVGAGGGPAPSSWPAPFLGRDDGSFVPGQRPLGRLLFLPAFFPILVFAAERGDGAKGCAGGEGGEHPK